MRIELSGFDRFASKLTLTEKQINDAYQTVLPAFSEQASAMINNILVQAAAQAGPEAFPLAYVEPMLEAAGRIMITQPNGIIFDFEEMGTADDLAEGYHYGAKIDGGGQVDLPYLGEPLKNDTATRYEAWQRVFHGESWHGLDYSGSWSETIAARLETWGDKAPQWLLLQYGQLEFEPSINPYPIVEELTFDLRQIFESMISTEISLIAAKFNKP